VPARLADILAVIKLGVHMACRSSEWWQQITRIEIQADFFLL
jgi:hypothetical protein